MEILILLVVVIVGAFWVKNQYPESGVAGWINNLLDKGLSLVNKSPRQNTSGGTVTSMDSYSSQQQPLEITAEIAAPQSSEPVVDATIAVMAGAGNSINPVPEDSALRRHYYAALQAERNSISHPYPTDSVLRRHYESHLESLVTAKEQVAVSVTKSSEPASNKLKAPEDQALRRHFLTQLRAEAEAKFLSRPTDSTLARHYENLIQTEIDTRLLDAA